MSMVFEIQFEAGQNLSSLMRNSVGTCLIISLLYYPCHEFYSHRLQFRGCGFTTGRTSITGFIIRNFQVVQDCEIKCRKKYCFIG